MRARFLRAAETEVEEAVVYFDRQREGLGERFERDLKETLGFIVERPLTGHPLTTDIRPARKR